MIRISAIRNSFGLKAISLTMAIIFLGEILAPHQLYALTSGPSQPEVQSFEPIGTTDMVDAFSGDFTYNIPLMDVDGYPINLSYHSGVGMDQEASWCGLGWNINPGVVNRNIRGIPDDFSGEDKVTKEQNIRPNKTFRVDFGTSLELIGFDEGIDPPGSDTGNLSLNVNFGLGIYYNNYRGMGYSLSASASLGIGPLNLGAQMGFDNQNGIDFNPDISLSSKAVKDKDELNEIRGGISMGYNSRTGLRHLTFSTHYERGAQNISRKDKTKKGIHVSNGIEGNGSASIDFAAPTYVPNVAPGMYTSAYTLTGKLGVSAFALDPTFSASVNYSESGVNTKTRDYQAYGYLYTHNGVGNDYAMHDVNREKEGGFSKYRQYLPLSNHSYDVYSVAGQGTGGIFRPHRGNIGTIYSTRAENSNWPSVNITIEAGMGPPPSGKIGGNIKVAWSNAHSGPWRDGNLSMNDLTFKGETVNSTFEPVYFKNAGEKSVNNTGFYNKYGNEKPVRVALSMVVPDALAHTYFKDKDNITYPITGGISRGSTRDKRNQTITYLTAHLASSFGLEKKIKNYKRTAAGGPEYNAGKLVVQNEIERSSSTRKSHHVSEVTSLNPDGTRYVYGLPAYNFVHVEKTFNVQDAGVDCSTGLVDYSGSDNTTGNTNGVDYYYSATKMPPYAHSYLLTAVLSTDYIDITGDGPSEDDYGNYTKFNYSQANSQSNPYKWRSPFYDANHNEGFKSDNTTFELTKNRRDDKGSYLYGEKEVWHLNSIETKNYIAEFYVSPRRDAWGVAGEDQDVGQDTTQMGAQSMKLDSIKLYSRFDRITNNTNAIPIKVVHFSYDYSLCKNVHNAKAGVGKLTLKRVWFTYGNNNRGALNDYEFTYSVSNPDYNMKSYDRWGNYKPNPSTCSNLQNSDFPYVNQDDDPQADGWASAWHLTSIKLPSGGKIQVNYESDDYAYVQNKPAMQMLKIKGFGETTSFSGVNEMYDLSGLSINSHEYVYFQMNKKYTTDAEVKEAYFRDMSIMYYNFLTNLTDDSDMSHRSEYIAGYMEIENAGISSVSDSIGFIKVKHVPIKDRENGGTQIHPVVKAALQYLRINCSELAYPPADPNFSPSIFDIVDVVFQFLGELKTMFLGFNRDRMLQGYCRKVTLDKSWIRVYEHSGFKKGGGSRVKKIEFFDEWSTMTGSAEPTFSYGQEYTYTMTDPLTGKTISSGVASYEPLIGGDENPWRMPIKYKEEIAGAPNNDYYLETPLGESYFPGASIGYRRIEIRNLKKPGVKRHATGKTVYEFYTAAEFPTITDNTDLEPEIHKPMDEFSFFGIKTEEFATASQGYVIELNDMHGKLKAQWNYSETNSETPLSGIEYFYKLNSDGLLGDYNYTGSKINNKVTVLQKDGTYAQKIVGEEIDMVVDANEKEEKNFVTGAQVNVDGFLAVIVPVIIPIILPEYSCTHNRIKTIVATKVVNRYALLQKTVAHDNGATISTENLAWDAETGEVLLTKTQNEYRDHIYNLTYPAHWAYDGMGQAYKNVGTSVQLNLNNGITVSPALANILVPGDELGVITPSLSTSDETKLWVLDVKNDSISVIYRSGIRPSGIQNLTCKILRSGRRNMQTLPIMNVVTRSNVLGSSGQFTNSLNQVISSEGIEYSQDWQMYRPTACNSFDECSQLLYCYLNSDFNLYYMMLLNELINQGRLNTSWIYTDFLASNVWSADFLDEPYVLTTILSDSSACISQYRTQSLLGSAGGHIYSGLQFQTNLSGSCNLHPKWCNRFKIYCTEDISSVNYLIDEVDQFLPGLTYCPTDMPDLSSLKYDPSNYTFYMNVLLQDGRKVPCYVITDCTTTGIQTCSPSSTFTCCREDSILNPYIWNLKGNWRAQRNFVYYDKVDSTFQRKQSETVTDDLNSTNTRYDGVLKNYKPLWKLLVGKWAMEDYNTPTSPWVWQSMASIYSPFNETESKNALNIYSSAVYGYHQTLPIAVAQNAMMRQIAYDGFEDYADTNITGGCPYPEHWNYKDVTSVVDITQPHTGSYCMKIPNGNVLSSTRAITNYAYSYFNYPGLMQNFRYKPQHLIEAFSPLGTGTYNYGSVVNKYIDGKYIISYWVRSDNFNTVPANPVVIYINGLPVILTSTGSDQIVENWKRIERSFTIPNGANSIKVDLTNTTGADLFYDDIRIHPFNSSMKTFAYNYISQRLMAQLDENNYATFYEYDKQGNLIRVKKETEKGIMTIQESRQHLSDH